MILILNYLLNFPMRMDNIKKYYQEFKAINPDVFLISAVTRNGVSELLNFMNTKVDEILNQEREIYKEFLLKVIK